MRALGDRIAALDVEGNAVEEEFRRRLLEVPNLPHAHVPVGPDESANVVVRTEGVLPTYGFAPVPHWELGPALGIIDFDRGVKIALGSDAHGPDDFLTPELAEQVLAGAGLDPDEIAACEKNAEEYLGRIRG